jgi:hypothetical protein
MQRSVCRWDARQDFHALQDRLLDQLDQGADHGWRELAQGTWEMGVAWAESRSLFVPHWVWRDGDDLMLIPLAVHPSGNLILTIARVPHAAIGRTLCH